MPSTLPLDGGLTANARRAQLVIRQGSPSLAALSSSLFVPIPVELGRSAQVCAQAALRNADRESISAMSVRRPVQFFLAQTPPDERGVRPPYDPSDALDVIRGLDWRDRYDQRGERILRLWPGTRGTSGMLGSVRRTALPPVDRGARIEDLELGPNEGIIEQTFFTVFDRRHVGIVRNQYGPALNRLSDYLDNLAPDVHPEVTFLPLARDDTLEQLRHIRRLRSLTLKVHGDAIDELQGEDTVYEALDPSRRLSDDVELIELNLSVARRRRASLGGAWERAVQRLSRRGDIGDLATKFVVSYEDDEGGRRTVNVLDDRLSSWQVIETTTERGGGLSSRSAYQAIQDAYGEFSDELERAAALETVD